MAGNSEPLDGNYKPINAVLTPGQGLVVPQGGTLATDSATGLQYAPTIVQQSAAATNVTLQNAAAANGNGTLLPVLGNASVIFTVTMTGFTGTVNFECSEDNTNYDPLQVQQEGTNLITTSITGSTTTSTHLYEGSVAGLQSVRARVSGFSAGTVTVTAHAIASTDAPRAINAVNTDGQKATYSASMLKLAVATGANIIWTLTGSATKTIRVTRLELSGTCATTAKDINFFIAKYSTAATGGTTGTAPTIAPHDSTSPAATAAITVYTADPTGGTSVGNIRAGNLFMAVTGSTVATGTYIADFGNRPAQALVLRGATQQIGISLNAENTATSIMDIFCEWTEE